MSDEIVVKDWWNQITRELLIPMESVELIWTNISNLYNDPARAYHNMSHIRALLALATNYKDKIQNLTAVGLAIMFHDIIYDPKSKLNEEKSAELFVEQLGSIIDPQLKNIVVEYIIATKEHNVSNSNDNDLKLFIDFDMSILGSHISEYQVYVENIRKEYSFIPISDFRKGRCLFLKKTLSMTSNTTDSTNVDISTTTIFATDEFRTLYENQAKSNISWEINYLSSVIDETNKDAYQIS